MSKEFEGKNLDVAVWMASQELDVPIEKLRYQVVDKGSRGSGGDAGKPARIRILEAGEEAAPAAPAREEPRERSRERSRQRPHKPAPRRDEAVREAAHEEEDAPADDEPLEEEDTHEEDQDDDSAEEDDLYEPPSASATALEEDDPIEVAREARRARSSRRVEEDDEPAPERRPSRHEEDEEEDDEPVREQRQARSSRREDEKPAREQRQARSSRYEDEKPAREQRQTRSSRYDEKPAREQRQTRSSRYEDEKPAPEQRRARSSRYEDEEPEAAPPPRRREPRERRRPEGALDPDDLEAGMEKAREVLPALIEAMGFDLDSDVEIREDHVYVPLQGEDCKYLLEHRAEGLNALQFLVNKMVYRGGPTRILVDADGYRKERQDELVAKAHRIADEVRDNERSRSLGSLNPFERRLVHLALREDEDVRTVSRGEGFMKRMEIAPRHGGDDSRPQRPERGRRRRERY